MDTTTDDAGSSASAAENATDQASPQDEPGVPPAGASLSAAFSPSSMADIDAARKDELIEYLVANRVPFGKGAQKGELHGKAREFFATQSAGMQPSADVELLSPNRVSDTHALSLLAAKGFQDKDDVVHMLNALARRETELRELQRDIDGKVQLLEQKDIEFAAREAAIKTQADEIHELNRRNDLQCQELLRLRDEIHVAQR